MQAKLRLFWILPCGNPHNASNERRQQISHTASQTSINIHFSCWTPRTNYILRRLRETPSPHYTGYYVNRPITLSSNKQTAHTHTHTRTESLVSSP